jgi:phage protein D
MKPGSPPHYAPEIRLSIGGQSAPAAFRGSLTSVRCTTGLDGADRLEIGLANEGLRWLDSPLFALDTEVELAIGYAPDEPTRIFNGIVVGSEATFPAESMPGATLIAQDRQVRLQQSSASRWFAIPISKVGNLPIPDIAVAPYLSLEHGLLPALDPVGAALSVLLGGASLAASFSDSGAMQKLVRKQHDESNFDFLRTIARENGWEVFIDHAVEPAGYSLRFMSPLNALDSDATLRYGASLLDFTPRVSNVGQVAAISVKVYRPEIRLEVTVTVGWDWDRQQLSLDVSPGFGAPKGSGSFTIVSEPVTLSNAARLIVGKLIPKLNRRQTATATTIGDPSLRAGGVVQIEGVGVTYGGRYRIAGATHTLDGSGYRTQLELRKEIWFGSIPPLSQGAVRINEGLLTLDADKSAALVSSGGARS